VTARERELLEATIAELDAAGYDGLTVDAVAARAHASKATLYRRWPSKLALVVAAIAARYDNAPFLAAADGSLREDLLRHVELLVEEVQTTGTVGAVLGAANRNPELRRALDEHFVAVRRDAMHALLERHRAELRDGVDPELAAGIPAALIYARLLVGGEPLWQDFARRVVDGVLLPLLTG
jgi:AcrR family transcriptional regulator